MKSFPNLLALAAAVALLAAPPALAANVKISALPAATTLSGPELVAGVQSATTVKITATQMKTFTSASPTLVTPVLGVASATSVNKVALTAPASAATLTIADGKTLTASNTLTLAGTDATVMTFPSTSASVARIDAAQTLAGTQTFSGAIINSGIATDATHTTSTVCQDTTTHQFYFGSGTLGICLGTSSARYKHDIAPLGPGLAQILALNPVQYFYNPGRGDNGARLQYGLTAEQTEPTLPTLVGLDTQGRPNSVDLLGMVPVLIKAVQEQQAQIEALKRQLAGEASRQKVALR